MKRSRKAFICIVLSLVLAYVQPQGVYADVSFPAAMGSYSIGPEYVFSYEKSAEEQLNDLFTTIDLQDATISDMQKEMEAGNLTSQQLTQMYLDRINAYDKSKNLNSIIRINENALNEAKALDEERASGKVRGKLHGIPIVVKDNYNVKGMPNTAGSVALANLIAPEDAETIRKLKDAGAVIIAKANLSEFAYSAVASHSTLGGDVHNAFDATRSPAGSSGGTATAVKSNFAAAGLGTDTGGSIRNPASYSNLFGIRPSKGLTSIDGVIPLEAPRDTTGPLAKNAEDLAIVLETMAGTGQKDDYTIEADADKLLGEGYSKSLSPDSLKGKRIAFLTSSFDFFTPDANKIDEIIYEETGITYHVDPDSLYPTEYLEGEMEILTRRARANLVNAGAEFVDLSGQLSDEMIYFLYMAVGGNACTEYDMNSFLSEYGGSTNINTVKDIVKTGENIGYMRGHLDDDLDKLADHFDKDDYARYGYVKSDEEGYIRPRDWERIKDYRDMVNKIMEENNVDAIMYTFFTVPAYSQTGNDYYNYNISQYNRVFGPKLGMPDISIPIGFMSPSNGEGGTLPIGMDLVGRFGGEKELLEIANAYEYQAGDLIKRDPEITPALRDERLNSYLDSLMEAACEYISGNYKNNGATISKVMKLSDAYNKALNANYSDPYSVYNAAHELAVAFDKLNTLSITLSKTSYKFDGKTKKPSVKVFLDGKKLSSGNYTVTYDKGRKNVGTYKVTVKAKGKYYGQRTAVFTINKAPNTLKATKKTVSVSLKKLSNNDLVFPVKKIINIQKPKGTLYFTKLSGNEAITIDGETGKATVAKGLAKGTYDVTVRVSVTGDPNYDPGYKDVTVKFKVK